MQRVYLEYLGDSVELPVGETVVGRDVGCALRFNDPALSRRHLRFVRREDEVFIEDLSSSNGTLVNGRKLSQALRVQDGDTILVGSRKLTFHVVDEGGLGESTLLLKNLESGLDRFKMRAVTAQFSVQLPPPAPTYQKCPRCAGPVTDLDDQCASCGYEWGDFRPMTVTAVRPTPLNRRRHDRQPIELSMIYTSKELEIEATTRDLSLSGVFVCTEVLDPVGTACELTILVDGGPALRTGGIVRRVVQHDRPGGEPNGLGVEFIGVGLHELSWIKSAVARIASGGADDGDTD